MISILLRTLISALKSRRALVLENLALRHQLDVLHRNVKRPRLTNRDPTLWVILSRLWPNWTFLKNHAQNIVSVDFFTVPTATFRVLFVFLVLSNQRRRIVHFNVTDSPSAIWIGQQIFEAFPWDTTPKYMIRDRDKKYGNEFIRRVESLEIKQVLISSRSPWQNPYVERVIGSIRRECLDHVIVFSERHLRRILRDYLAYYHGSRTQLGLEKDCPRLRPVEPPDLGPIRMKPMVGGLHHRYFRQAA